MARKKPAAPVPASPIRGKTFWLDKKIGSYEVSDLRTKIERLGGSITARIDAKLDYLVLAEDRRGSPGRSQAERDLAKLPSARASVIYAKDAHQFVCPLREEALAILARAPHSREEWQEILPRSLSGVQIDLSGADLGGLDLTGYYLWGLNLAGANLDGTILAQAYLHNMRGVDFRKIGNHEGVRISDPVDCIFDGLTFTSWNSYGAVVRCSFRGANLRQARFWSTGSQDLDFTDADCTGADFGRWTVSNLVAERANFSQARLHSANWAGARLTGAKFPDAVIEEANLSGADLTGCDLQRANRSRANLSGANLTRADLRHANLAETDLTGANLTGADLTGANLRDTKFDGIKRKGVKGLTSPASPATAGPLLTRLLADLGSAKEWHLHFTLTDTTSGTQRFELNRYPRAIACSLRTENAAGSSYSYPPVAADALLDLATLHPGAALQLDSIKLRPVSLGKPAEALAVQALCEVFGQAIPETAQVGKARKAARAGTATERDGIVADLKRGGDAIATWNARPEVERKTLGQFEDVDFGGLDLRKINLTKTNLSRARLEKSDLREANFESSTLRKTNFRGADLRTAKFSYAVAQEADFEGADLRDAHLYWVGLRKANLKNANLRGANLMRSRLQGADLTGADLANVTIRDTEYDADTKFPAGFHPGTGWKYTGKTPRPTPAGPVGPAPMKQDLDFVGFYHKLPGVAEQGRIANAIEMLKAERFSLFAEVGDEQVIGVIRSQSSKERVYACRLTSSGQYECGTQNLRICGGLRGAVCKHLLVLILGLAKSATLDPGTALLWLQLARRQSPGFDKDGMTATFLKYKGVVDGEIDWRPTETVPEDYYAL